MEKYDKGSLFMISEEIILSKDRVECLVNTLARMLQIESLELVKIRFTEDTILTVPLCKTQEMKR